jgi:hypothetical protein
MSFLPSIVTWNRLEPRPRTADVKATLEAEIRDPAWLLARQWQLGEFGGEDAGSPAFVDISWRKADLRSWTAGSVSGNFDGKSPLERFPLAEPFSADQATRVELGQVFLRVLDDAYAAATPPGPVPTGVRSAFTGNLKIAGVTASTFNSLEDSTRQFQLVVLGRALDGYRVLTELVPTNAMPPGLANPPAADVANIKAAYKSFGDWVTRVYGSVAATALATPPAAWDAQHLDNTFTVTAGANGGATLAAQPDSDGRLEWSSFDLKSQTADPFTGTTAEPPLRIAPGHLRFPGMPANRYWDFEEGDLSFPDVDVELRDMQKLVVLDFALIHGVDWFVCPLEVPVGKIARVDSLVVRDVFGVRTTVNRADDVGTAPSTSRWTMFSVGQPSAGLASFIIVPPSAGPALVTGPVLEEVRFARDEQANMAWAIERATESRMGERREGSERDAAADAAIAATAPPPGDVDPTVPLKYEVESKVPVNWIPLVAQPNSARAPAFQLQKARVLRAVSGTPQSIAPLGRILKPEPYFLPEEEVPRAGLRIERVIFRSRWIDGSVHMWSARRRSGGAGETQSGLRFDTALPNRT